MIKTLNLLTAAAIIAVSLMILVGRASAQDVYMGKFSATKDVYLITESVNGRDKNNFRCAVHVVDRVSTLIWRYEFFSAGGEPQYTLIMNTGFRHTSRVFDGQPYSQPVMKIYRYVQANY